MSRIIDDTAVRIFQKTDAPCLQPVGIVVAPGTGLSIKSDLPDIPVTHTFLQQSDMARRKTGPAGKYPFQYAKLLPGRDQQA